MKVISGEFLKNEEMIKNSSQTLYLYNNFLEQEENMGLFRVTNSTIMANYVIILLILICIKAKSGQIILA